MADIQQQLQNLVLSDMEIASMTGWPPKMIEDYLNIISNFILLATSIDFNVDQIEQNTIDIDTNTTDISTNTTDISTNTTDIETNATNLTNHINSDTQHGVTGVNVGTEDFCTEDLGGVVLLSDLVDDVVSSTVSVTSPDASAAPVAYSQTQVQEIVTLSNEMKADINTLVTDVNNAITQINDFIAKNKTANQMSTV